MSFALIPPMSRNVVLAAISSKSRLTAAAPGLRTVKSTPGSASVVID